MASTAGVTFSKIPTLSNFQALATQSPAEAKAVLGRIAQGLSKSAVPPEQKQQLDALLQAQDAQLAGLTASSPALKALFPDAPAATGFAEVIAQIASLTSLNWTADAVPPQVAVTGTVARDATDHYILTTASGRQYMLTDSPRNAQLSGGWIEGFINDGEGPLTVQGTVTADGKAFAVEGYSPGSSPDFVTGRVVVQIPLGNLSTKPTPDQLSEVMGPNGHVFITSARGDVEVVNPELKKVLALMPRLGVILPGAVKRADDGKMTTQAGPDFLYALGGRFNGLTDKGGGVYETNAAFAYNQFMGPVQAAGETAKWRMQNSANQRNWVGGAFKLDAPVPYFEAKYVSNDLGTYNLGQDVSAAGEGSAAAQLLAASEVVDPADDFVRPMGPPPAPPAAAPTP